MTTADKLREAADLAEAVTMDANWNHELTTCSLAELDEAIKALRGVAHELDTEARETLKPFWMERFIQRLFGYMEK